MSAITLPPASEQASDAALVDAALAGDAIAFQELFLRHRVAVRRAVDRRVRHRDVVDDHVQEVFLRAFVRLGSLRDRTRFLPWVLQIARNVALDALRRSARAVPVTADVDDLLADEGHEPPVVFELRQLHHRMRHGMALLSARDRAALRLVCDGCSPAEVAGELGVTPATAKVVVHRARRRLLAAIA